MGREKNTPKKNLHIEETFTVYDYRPIMKKKKSNRQTISCSPKYFDTIQSDESNKQYYLGRVAIGNTDNVFPKIYSVCKVCFKESSTNEESESLIFNIDDTCCIVTCTENIHFIKELVVAKIFALDFCEEDGQVFVSVYFFSIPLPIFSKRVGNTIKNVFKLFFNIEINNYTDDFSTRIKKRVDGNSEISELYNKLFALRKYDNDSIDENVQHPYLKPILRPYQIKAVQWMLGQEKKENSQNDELHPLYMPVKLKSSLMIYYDKFNGDVVQDKPVVNNITKGGILADEMGLGKTVEVFACILAKSNIDVTKENIEDAVPTIYTPHKKHYKVKDDVKKTKNISPGRVEKKSRVPEKFTKKNKSANYVALQKWYNEKLSELSPIKHVPQTQISLSVQCICGESSEKGLVKCTNCEKYQHKYCLGYNESFGVYNCPQCWMEEELINSDGTLIVTPISLKAQWCKEISKHIKGSLNVLVYEGYSVSPVYPTNIRNYDIVITTYNVLQNELRLTESVQTVSFRNTRKYSPPGCPLTRVNWRRLCLDEAQVVDTGKMVAEMAGKITACFRWAITGTPISKNITDLFGLIEYLKISPYNDYNTYKNVLYDPYINGNQEPMLTFLKEVLWRTAKKDVSDQINIPNQTFREHFLEFSAVERYYYKREHEMTSADFLERVTKYDPTLLLQDLDKDCLKRILIPLTALRHTCTHPYIKRGRYLATRKNVSSMKDLLDVLIVKNATDSEECLRFVASAINGIAGINLLLHEPQEAIDRYREVLQLSSRFSGKNSEANIAVDKLLLIHAMHNLAEIFDSCAPNQPTIRDGSLRTDCLELEKEYIEKFIQKTTSAFENFQKSLSSVNNLQNKISDNGVQWFSEGLKWIFNSDYYDELLDRIYTGCANANVKCEIRIERILLCQQVCLWLDEIIDLREKLSEAIDDLYEISESCKILIKDNIVQQATNCHLRPNKKDKKRKICLVCISNSYLKNYEAKLFSMSQRTKNFTEMSLQGSWKPTFQELVLKAILSLLKSRNGNSLYVSDGDTHIELIDNLKKEFKELRRFWTFLDQQICAQDELDICKIRFQLNEGDSDQETKTTNSNKIIKNLSYTLENKHETVNLLNVHELDYQKSLLQSEAKANSEKLEKLLGTQNYLETLRKQQYEGHSPDPCPICRNPLEKHWSILLCGHSYCLECIHTLLEKATGDHLQCSVCRNKQNLQEISYIRSGNTVSNEDRKINGSYSTKIEAVVKLMLELVSQDANVKVLIFSFWVTILKNLKEALLNNNIKCEFMSNNSSENKIENFKDSSKGITVLLLPIHLGSKGLNLIEATHAVLIEPLINPSDELQAIGRIHRIGQTKPTVVHRFIVKNTIEDSIYKATNTNAEDWDKSKVTLQNLINLFKVSEEIVHQASNE